MKTIRMEANGKNGLNKFTGYRTGLEAYCVRINGGWWHGHAAKKTTYNSNNGYVFSRPSKDCFYMRVLRSLIAAPATKKDLGLVNRNASVFTAMRNAGLIDYARSDKTWNITAVGKDYFYKAMKLLSK